MAKHSDQKKLRWCLKQFEQRKATQTWLAKNRSITPIDDSDKTTQTTKKHTSFPLWDPKLEDQKPKSQRNTNKSSSSNGQTSTEHSLPRKYSRVRREKENTSQHHT